MLATFSMKGGRRGEGLHAQAASGAGGGVAVAASAAGGPIAATAAAGLRMSSRGSLAVVELQQQSREMLRSHSEAVRTRCDSRRASGLVGWLVG